MSQNNGGSMSGFLLGAAIGAGLAMLLAPMSGGDTRRHIGGAVGKLKEDASDAMKNVKGFVKDGAERVHDAFATGKDAMHRDGKKATVNSV